MTISVRLAALKAWALKLLDKQGVFPADAETVARRLIESELLDRPAGGLRWLPRLISAMDVGDIDPRARLLTLVDLPALAVIDGSTGLGQAALTHALHLAAKKATQVGSAVVIVKNSRPVGDPTACLAAATSAGCVASVMTTCKPQTDPWPIGPCTAWGWPNADSPLVTTNELPPMLGNRFADILSAGLAGKKPASLKKKLFADDAEHVCFAIDPARCADRDQFQSVTSAALGTNGLIAPAWIFDPAKWPETVTLSEEVVVDLRELATSARTPAEW